MMQSFDQSQKMCHNQSVISLTEQIDTTTPGGKLIFHLMGALAEFERDLIRERTNAGLAAAKARGRVGGRPRKLKTNGKVALARRMFADQSHSIPEICAALGISRATLYRYVKETELPTEFQNLHMASSAARSPMNVQWLKTLRVLYPFMV